MARLAFILLFAVFIKVSNAMSDSDIHLKFNILFKEVSSLKKQASHSSSYCKLLKNPCGPCRCFDEYRTEQKYYCDCQELTPKRDCLAFYTSGYRVNGLYKITMNSWYSTKLIQVYCDQTTDGGGWTVFQRRNDGSVDFYRNWNEYKRGFGDIRNEFWLGNDYLHDLVYQAHLKGNDLRVDLKNYDGGTAYAKYGYFKVESEQIKYQINVGSYSGTAGNALSYHNGMKFSTYDQDNDAWGSHCAQSYVSGWWYRSCVSSHLNGVYASYKGSYRGNGIYWSGFISGTFSKLKWTEMKVRRKI